jgi:hypothetical protein
MEIFTTLADIWRKYDVVEKKQFLSHDVSASINSLPKDNPEQQQCLYEAMAFEFAENCDGKEWNTYYGPQWTFTKKDTGEEVYVPNIKDVTEEMIAYWEERTVTVKNPLLKMRYTGLVLEFKKKLFNKEPDYKSIKLAHIQSLLDVVEGDYCQNEIIAFDYAERALNLSVYFRNHILQERAVKVYYEAHQRHSNNDMLPGVWGRIFRSLIKHQCYFQTYEKELLDEQLSRYDRLKKLAFENGDKTDQYSHVLSEQINLLADYYHLTREKEKIEPLLDTMLEVIKLSIPVRGGMWGQLMIQQLQARYRKYGFDKRANQLYVMLSDLGGETLSELKSTEYSIPLDRDRINAFLDAALDGSDSDVLMSFLFQYIPKIQEEKIRLKERAEKAPLLDLVSTFTIDSSGNTISRVGVGLDAERQKLYFFMYESMRLIIPFMHLHITKMKEQGKMTTESIMELIKDSELITEDHKEIVRRGMDAYMAEDYLVCCHLLIPQLEAAIRRLFALNGANIMRSKKNPDEGNEYRSLDSLLGSTEAVAYMGEDIANYFRNVLTDQYGWNIRNQVSHGLLASDKFNFGMADRVVHAFIMLGVLKKK